MYFGQPLRPFRPLVAPTSRGVAARPFSPVSRGVPAPRRFVPPQTAPSMQRVAPHVPSAWAVQQQQILARHAANQARQAAEINRLRNQAEARQRAWLATQQAQAQAQAAQTTAVAVQTPPTPAATPQISPGSPEADLRPTQDAADGGEQPEAAPPSSKKKFLLIGLALVAVGGVGYVVMTRKKKPKVA